MLDLLKRHSDIVWNRGLMIEILLLLETFLLQRATGV